MNPVVQFILGAVLCVIGGGFGVYLLYLVIRNFRGTFVDQRDVVQFLGRDTEDEEEPLPQERVRGPAVWDRSPTPRCAGSTAGPCCAPPRRRRPSGPPPRRLKPGPAWRTASSTGSMKKPATAKRAAPPKRAAASSDEKSKPRPSREREARLLVCVRLAGAAVR